MRSRGPRFALVRWATFALAFGVAASFAKGRTIASAAPPVVHPLGGTAAVPPPADGEHGAGKKGEGQFKDSAVYVDGKAVGVLRYS